MGLGPSRLPMPPAPTGSAPADPQAQKLLTQMTRLDGDLKQIEKQVLAWARAPLSRETPLQDLEGRIQSHKVGGCEDGGEEKQSCAGGVRTKDEASVRAAAGTRGKEGSGQSRAPVLAPSRTSSVMLASHLTSLGLGLLVTKDTQ